MGSENKKEIGLEYDAQLYGFTADDFLMSFKRLFHEHVCHNTGSLVSSLIKRYPEGDPEIELIKDRIGPALVDKYMSKAEDRLQTLKTQLNEVMNIPPHVLLPEDQPQRTQYSAEEVREVDHQMKDLVQRLKRAKAFKAELQQERKMLEDILPDLSKRVEELNKIVYNQKKSENIVGHLEPVIEEVGKSMEELPSL